MSDLEKCEHVSLWINCREKAVWKVVSECMIGASEYDFYCQKHAGKHLSNGAETYFRSEGWIKNG